MNKKGNLSLLATFTIAIIGICSCQSDRTPESESLHVYLTDDPIRMEAVNIEILSLEAKVDDSREHGHDDHHGDMDHDGDDHQQHHDEYGTWVNIPFTPGIYNVLSLRNGIDTLLSSAVVNGRVRKLRLTIGTNNTVLDSGVVHPLTVQNATDSFLYVHLFDKHRGRHNSGGNAVWIDFDLGRSIFVENGQYVLKPNLRPFCPENFGALEGKVLPAEALARVIAYNATDTAVAIPNSNGYFHIRGLESGVYNVLFDGQPPYRDTVINNINVPVGRRTYTGQITLTQ